MWTKLFWSQALERAIKAAANAPLSAWGTGKATGLFSLDWRGAVSVAGMAAVVSLLMSIGSASTGDSTSPSLVATK